MKSLILLVGLLLASGVTGFADPLAEHGMLVFGNKVIYASHLPMFHHPHNYQVIFKISLSGAAMAKYNMAKDAGHDFFTMASEKIDLTRIMDGSEKGFSASLYDGHFERGGENLGDVYVRVGKVIYSSVLDAATVNDGNEYLIFGESGEYFAAHLIQGAPNFDQILALGHPYRQTVCHKRYCPDHGIGEVVDSEGIKIP